MRMGTMLRVDTAPTIPHMVQVLSWWGDAMAHGRGNFEFQIDFHVFEITISTIKKLVNANFAIQNGQYGTNRPSTPWTCAARPCCRPTPPQQPGLAEQVRHLSPTCLRRVRRLHERLIERQVAICRPPAGRREGHMAGMHRRGHAGPPGRRTWLDAFEARAVKEAARAAVLARVAGPGLCAGGAHARHAGLPGAGAAPVHAGRQRAQREGFLPPNGQILPKVYCSARQISAILGL